MNRRSKSLDTAHHGDASSTELNSSQRELGQRRERIRVLAAAIAVAVLSLLFGVCLTATQRMLDAHQQLNQRSARVAETQAADGREDETTEAARAKKRTVLHQRDHSS